MSSWLLVVEADELDIGKKYVLKPDESVFIGRSENATFRVRDKFISRFHCAIVNKGDYSIVIDLGSENGVLVNGAPVDKKPLQDGDVIQLGTAEIIYRSDVVRSLHPSAPPAGAAVADKGLATARLPSKPEPTAEAPEEVRAAQPDAPETTPASSLAEAPAEPPAIQADAAGPHVTLKQQAFNDRKPPSRPTLHVPQRPEPEPAAPKAPTHERPDVTTTNGKILGAPEEVFGRSDRPKVAGKPTARESSFLLKPPIKYVEAEAEDPDKTPPSGIFLKENLEGIETGEAAQGKILTAKCEECRLVKKDIYWKPGMRCPRCKSKKFFPVIVVDQEHEYRHAERSRGPAEVDRLLCHIACWSGIISPRQMARCFKEMERMARQRRPVPGVDRLLTRFRYCGPEHISALFEVMNFQSLHTATVIGDEEDFLSRATGSQWLTEKQAEFLRSHQEETAASGKACTPIGWTAIEKGILSEPRVIALYLKQQENKRGLIFEVHRALELLGAKLPERIPHSAIDHRWMGFAAASVLLALILVNLLSAAGYAGPWARNVSVVPAAPSTRSASRIVCESCGKSAIENLYDVSLRCPFCGQKAPSAELECRDCGHVTRILPRKPGNEEDAVLPMPACEKCHSTNVTLRLKAPSARGY